MNKGMLDKLPPTAGKAAIAVGENLLRPGVTNILKVLNTFGNSFGNLVKPLKTSE